MHKTTLYLEEETRLVLRQAVKREGKTQAELLRAAVRNYAAGLRTPRARGIGAYRSGRSNVSEQAENLPRAAAKARKPKAFNLLPCDAGRQERRAWSRT